MRNMIINRLFATNYKNLVNCTIEPRGLHALTGCNGSGKSNFLEVPEFITSIISESDEIRERIFRSGYSPLGGCWFPFVKSKEYAAPFVFELNACISVQEKDWEVDYYLQIDLPEFIKPYQHEGTGKILAEKVKIKECNKPGQKKLILNRVDSFTTISSENSRKKLVFKTKSDMSALQAIEVREADDYANNFPVLSEFHKALLSFNLLKLNPDKLIMAADHNYTSSFQSKPGSTIDFFPMFSLLQEIQANPPEWTRLLGWLKRLCNIDDVNISEETVQHGDNTKGAATLRYIFIYQHGRILFPNELSTGCAMLLGLLIAAHSFLPLRGTVILEEPETYLHPKAIIDVITLLREISETNSVIFSTHSPVTLNSMQPSEVTVMETLPNGFVTTRKVSDIKDAINTLNRGYVSFGDLLQSNFTLDECQ